MSSGGGGGGSASGDGVGTRLMWYVSGGGCWVFPAVCVVGDNMSELES